MPRLIVHGFTISLALGPFAKPRRGGSGLSATVPSAKFPNTMNRKVLILLLSVLAVGLWFWTSVWSVSESSIVGGYTNTNYGAPIAEVPDGPDTLVLMPSGAFTSGFYGRGTYTVEMEGLRKVVQLKYPYEFGMAGNELPIDVTMTRDIRLMLNYDMDQCYQKIW